MNFESIKSGFLRYLEEKRNKTANVDSLETNTDKSNVTNIPYSEISIFLYSNDFQNYLVQEIGADASIFSKTINEIMDMELSNGKLEDPAQKDYNLDALNTSAEGNESNEINMSTYLSESGEAGNETVIPSEIDLSKLAQSVLNDAFNNENVIKMLDTNSSGELDQEEITAFLEGVQGQNENGELTFDNLANTISRILASYGQQSNDINTPLSKIFKNSTVIKALDTDNDGKINDAEKEKFLKFVKENYSDDNTLTEESLKAAADDIINGKFSYNNFSADALNLAGNEIQNTNSSDISGTTGPSGSSGTPGTSRTGGSSNYSGTTGSSASSPSANTANSVKSMTLEELNQQKTRQEGELQTARDGVDAVYSGENEAVKGKEAIADEAKKAYDEAVENDKQISDELKQKRTQNLDAISKQEEVINELNTKINGKEAEINSQESVVSEQESHVSALEGALSALEGQTSDDPEKQKEINSKKQELRQKIKDTKQTLETAKQKLNNLKSDLETLNTQLPKEQEALDKLNEEKAGIEAEIAANCSQETKDAMKKYNDAKTDVDETKKIEAEKAKSKVKEAETNLKETEKLINEKKAEETKKEYSVGNDLSNPKKLFDSLNLEKLGITYDCFSMAAEGYNNLDEKYKKTGLFGVFDTTTHKYCLIDLNNMSVYDSAEVRTGSGNKMSDVSAANKEGSHSTLSGFFQVGSEYYSGKHATGWTHGIRMKGLEQGINDNCLSKACVVHMTNANSTWGCWGVKGKSQEEIKKLFPEGAVVFNYTKSDYVEKSDLV